MNDVKHGIHDLLNTPHGTELVGRMPLGTDYMWMPARQRWVVAHRDFPPFLFDAQTGKCDEIKPGFE